MGAELSFESFVEIHKTTLRHIAENLSFDYKNVTRE
jgi:hypothetical protein